MKNIMHQLAGADQLFIEYEHHFRQAMSISKQAEMLQSRKTWQLRGWYSAGCALILGIFALLFYRMHLSLKIALSSTISMVIFLLAFAALSGYAIWKTWQLYSQKKTQMMERDIAPLLRESENLKEFCSWLMIENHDLLEFLPLDFWNSKCTGKLLEMMSEDPEISFEEAKNRLSQSMEGEKKSSVFVSLEEDTPGLLKTPFRQSAQA